MHATTCSLHALWLCRYRRHRETLIAGCFVALMFYALRISLWQCAKRATLERFGNLYHHIRICGGEAMMLFPFLMQVSPPLPCPVKISPQILLDAGDLNPNQYERSSCCRIDIDHHLKWCMPQSIQLNIGFGVCSDLTHSHSITSTATITAAGV